LSAFEHLQNGRYAVLKKFGSALSLVTSRERILRSR